MEAAEAVHHGLGGDTAAGFSEACFQAALSCELVGSQREVVRPVQYGCRATGAQTVVGMVRFDLVYGPYILEIKSYRTKPKSLPPPALRAQLAAYRAVMAPHEILVAVLFWKNTVEVFQYNM